MDRLASNGQRPASSRPDLQRRPDELDIEHKALRTLLERALREKRDYVREHRDRLAKLAREFVESRQAEARRLIDELAAVRDELAAARENELWALCFSNDAATRMPNARLLCGARKQPLQLAGINAQVDASRLLDAFRDDVEWLGRMATP